MYALLARRLPRILTNVLVVVWYALLIAGILLCYRRDADGFLYLHY